MDAVVRRMGGTHPTQRDTAPGVELTPSRWRPDLRERRAIRW